MNMYRTIASALTDDGRYVGSFEHDDLKSQAPGPASGAALLQRRHPHRAFDHEDVAPGSGALFFKHSRSPDSASCSVGCESCRAGLACRILRLAAALPFVRHFGELLLLTAQNPVRLPVEGQHRSGSRIAKGVYRYYMRKKTRKRHGVKSRFDPRAALTPITRRLPETPDRDAKFLPHSLLRSTASA